MPVVQPSLKPASYIGSFSYLEVAQAAKTSGLNKANRTRLLRISAAPGTYTKREINAFGGGSVKIAIECEGDIKVFRLKISQFVSVPKEKSSNRRELKIARPQVIG